MLPFRNGVFLIANSAVHGDCMCTHAASGQGGWWLKETGVGEEKLR